MSFRNEEKIITTFFQQGILLNEIKKLGGYLLYPKRYITSIYFDTNNFQMFNDSEESILPRKKIRIRHYEQDIYSSNFEIKISSTEGKFKQSFKLDEKQKKEYLSKGYIDQYYGRCKPVVQISYDRVYYHLGELRITFDNNIKYKNYASKYLINEKMSVVELKSSSKKEIDKIDNLLSLSRQRFSKYSRACIELNV